jgi:hypothetical protein
MCCRRLQSHLASDSLLDYLMREWMSSLNRAAEAAEGSVAIAGSQVRADKSSLRSIEAVGRPGHDSDDRVTVEEDPRDILSRNSTIRFLSARVQTACLRRHSNRHLLERFH